MGAQRWLLAPIRERSSGTTARQVCPGRQHPHVAAPTHPNTQTPTQTPTHLPDHMVNSPAWVPVRQRRPSGVHVAVLMLLRVCSRAGAWGGERLQVTAGWLDGCAC